MIALDNSIKKYNLVDNPKEADIVKRLGNVSHITDIDAATEDNDPNGHLHKKGGYTSQIYFLSNLVAQSDVSGNSVIEKGTDGGGSIEIYETPELAEARSKYLGALDGGIFDSGFHNVIGTVLIRTSDKLTATQQKELEAAIVEALTKLE